MEVVVSTPLCPPHATASAGAKRSDELLCDQAAELLEKFSTSWCRARTRYRYEGWVHREHLRLAGDWIGRNKRLARVPFADVSARPEVKNPMLDTLPRGALATPVGEAGEGWQRTALPDDREGYTECSLWEDDHKTPPAVSGEALRARTVEVALSYQGTRYRWGGKFPLGVDCSGLTLMAWFFCGVSPHRGAWLVDSLPAWPIPFEARKPGDLSYFPDHIALYLGNDRHIHSTARAGSDGVVINSLDPAVPDYRAGLRGKLYVVGSMFPLAWGGGYGHSPLPLVRLSVGAVLGAVSSFVISGGGT